MFCCLHRKNLDLEKLDAPLQVPSCFSLFLVLLKSLALDRHVMRPSSTLNALETKTKNKSQPLNTHLLQSRPGYQVETETFSSVTSIASVVGNKKRRLWLGRSHSTVTLFRFKLFKLVLPESK